MARTFINSISLQRRRPFARPTGSTGANRQTLRILLLITSNCVRWLCAGCALAVVRRPPHATSANGPPRCRRALCVAKKHTKGALLFLCSHLGANNDTTPHSARRQHSQLDPFHSRARWFNDRPTRSPTQQPNGASSSITQHNTTQHTARAALPAGQINRLACGPQSSSLLWTQHNTRSLVVRPLEFNRPPCEQWARSSTGGGSLSPPTCATSIGPKHNVNEPNCWPEDK